jgi:DNA-binding transcriptional regulator YiaG
MTEKPDGAAVEETVFVDATKQVNELLADPMVRDLLASGREARAEMNRAYAMNLAALRKAEELTQTALARRMGIEQAAVSKIERREDMLLSTLTSYLTAAGADSVAIVVTVKGREYSFDLGPAPKDQSSQR